jgi:hypothetical protein
MIPKLKCKLPISLILRLQIDWNVSEPASHSMDLTGNEGLQKLYGVPDDY